MNATVTKSAKSAKKIAPKKAVATTRAKPASKAPAKKSPAKTVAGKAVKPASKAAKPAAKAVKKTPAKSAVKSPKAAVKTKAPAVKSSTVKSAKPLAKPAAAKPAAKASPATKVTATANKAAVVTAKPNKDASRSTTGSSSKAVSKVVDKIEKPVVLKASEVATKSSKSTSVASDTTLLTEAQILKMGEKDYMNDAQLAFFKNRLQQLEKDLLKNADETTEHLRETVLVPDPADRATIEEEHALELRTRDRERKLLKKVQQSLLSIDSGEYGWCEETGEPIGVPRLLARPTATLSLEAQQRRELKQKLYGD
ncbi:dnaK suppressor protein [Janthinobacterium sp. Marseille]|nr:dnaK suppressor protein [Janthinobacterium sp. Marseille]